MRVTATTTHDVSTQDALSSRWLQPWKLGLLASLALSASVGCAGVGAGEVEEPVSPEESPSASGVVAEQPAQAALRNGVLATPDEVGGFSTDGVGVYLSATGNTAELTLYVVAPAEVVTFARPALYLTTQEGTDVQELDDVTLEMGESRIFRKEASGALMEAFADFGPDEG